MAACSWPHSKTLSLQATYGDHQLGAFENFDQSVEDAFVILRPWPKIFFEYELRLVNCLKSQLLISHLFLPHQTNAPVAKGTRNQAAFEKYPRLFDTIDQIFVTKREPAGRNGGDFLVLSRIARSTPNPTGCRWFASPSMSVRSTQALHPKEHFPRGADDLSLSNTDWHGACTHRALEQLTELLIVLRLREEAIPRAG
jgi:hypothetical protein